MLRKGRHKENKSLPYLFSFLNKGWRKESMILNKGWRKESMIYCPKFPLSLRKAKIMLFKLPQLLEVLMVWSRQRPGYPILSLLSSYSPIHDLKNKILCRSVTNLRESINTPLNQPRKVAS